MRNKQRIEELESRVTELEDMVVLNHRLSLALLERIRVHEEATDLVEKAWEKMCKHKADAIEKKREKRQ